MCITVTIERREKMNVTITLDEIQAEKLIKLLKESEKSQNLLNESNVIKKAYGNTKENYKYYYEKVDEFMEKFTVKQQNTGYSYLVDALIICLNNENYLRNLNSFLYPILADKHRTTVKNIERNLRYTIQQIFDYNSKEQMIGILGKNAVKDADRKPTTSEFLNSAIRRLKLE